MRNKNNLVSIKSSAYDGYLNVNPYNKNLEFNEEYENNFFNINLVSTNKVILKSADGHYVRVCDDDVVRADTLDIDEATTFDVSFVNKKEMYLKSDSNFLYVDKNSTLKSDCYCRNSKSLFKMIEQQNKSREPFVSIYSDANYQGKAQPLVPGYYNINDLYIGNDTLSSIKVPKGLVAVLYSDADFNGDSITVTSDTPYIGDYFNDKVSSIIVKKVDTPKPSNTSVSIYSDASYQGNSQTLSPGSYDIYDLTIGNDTLSSIKVPKGLVAILYSDANFNGDSIVVTSDTPYIGNYFNDKVSSIIVKKAPKNSVEIYSDANYQGNSQMLSPGSYDIYDLTIGNDTLSSIKVPNGYLVTLYSDANFKGDSITVTSDTPYIGDYFNDKVSSIVVKTIK
ncbi:MAG: beta/gamma crystallin-related protein [Paraclostridium sp.]